MSDFSPKAFCQSAETLLRDRSRLSPTLQREIDSLGREKDEELFWAGMLRSLERRELRVGDGAEASLLPAWIQSPGISPEQKARLERKLEAIQGRGSFGSRSENFLSNFHRQAFDIRSLAPMLAAGLIGKLAQGAALGRFAASAPAWWSRGLAARSAAWGFGLAGETLVLGWSHGDFGRSALSLAALKGGFWAGGKLSSPLPLTMVGAALLAHKAEEGLGWRAPSSFGDSLTEAGASALSYGLGLSLASRILGPRFRELQHRLDLSVATLPPAGARLAMAGPLPTPKPMLMSQDFSSQPKGGIGRGSEVDRVIRVRRAIPNSSGPNRPFDLIFSSENRRPFLPEAKSLEGQPMAIAERDGSLFWVKVDKRYFNTEGDPITPAGVTRVNFRLGEGETRGRAFAYYDSKAVTLFFIDLEETMITGGAPMRPGSGSVFLAWLAEQAWRQGKSFNVTRITSPQTVKILQKMDLVESSCRVEACARLNPESLDEEFRVLAEFPFGDSSGWNRHRHESDFFNVFGKRKP